MYYNVARDGQQLGRVSEAELKAGLPDGRYFPTDLVWREGMEQWVTLGELLGTAPAPPAAMAGAPQQPRAAGAAAVAPQVGGPADTSAGQRSLIAGIIALVTCGFCGIGSLVAIIMGHKALSRIKKTGAAGRGMAVAGLIMGYVSIPAMVLLALPVGASLALPMFVKVQEKGITTKMISQARELHEACKRYAADNGGRYPDSLDQLVEKNVLTADSLQDLNSLKPPTWEGDPGFEYLGAGKNNTALAETEILVSKAVGNRGERIISYYDGSTTLVTLRK